MSEENSSPVLQAGVSMLFIVLGVAFMLCWLCMTVILAYLLLLPSLMANDSGRLSGDRHLFLVAGMYGGLTAAGLAGIPGGLAFFWRRRRRRLLWTFGIMLGLGILTVILSFILSFS